MLRLTTSIPASEGCFGEANMKMRTIVVLAGLLLACLAGCQNTAQTGAAVSQSPAAAASGAAEAQIRAAIQEHLQHTSNLNLQAFDTDIKQVTVQGDHAQAQVDFHIKGGQGVMQMTYQLENSAGTWAVTASNPSAGDGSHPTVDQSRAPGAAPAPGENPHSLADTLRSFKEGGAAGAPQELPPGHPPLNNGAGPPPQ
jgi:hypothetical protein